MTYANNTTTRSGHAQEDQFLHLIALNEQASNIRGLFRVFGEAITLLGGT